MGYVRMGYGISGRLPQRVNDSPCSAPGLYIYGVSLHEGTYDKAGTGPHSKVLRSIVENDLMFIRER